MDITPQPAPALLEQARAGDPEAFGELCRLHETRLLRQAVILSGNAALAEELAQDTLVEAWRCLRRFDGRCQFFTWLCAILLNRHRNLLRKKMPIPFSALPSHIGEVMDGRAQGIDGGATPDEAALDRERAALVRACMAALPMKHRQVIYLRFFVDDSLEGIAAALRCSVGTVKSRLFHALDKLRCMKALHIEFNSSTRKAENP